MNAVATFLKDGELPERINYAIPIDECKGVLSAAYPMGYPESNGTQKFQPSTIFGNAKPAIVLVITKHFEPARVRLQPSTSARPDHMSDAEVLAFIQSFVNGHDSDAPIDMTALYVPRPIYMQYGEVDRDFIQRDVPEYRQKWPIRHYRLASTPEITRHKNPDILIVSYRMAFQVENSTKQISGEAGYLVGILDLAKDPRILRVTETILWRRITNKKPKRILPTTRQ